ncbi:unannotated protein [freshwater metagenome]|uniref:Unannotated protein n=1 Tax=freshwater metagenome TaxID=449393 RepID=A0A6J6HJ75_9ZZZZ
MYSPAACASIVRAAPAKNRRLSIVRSNSKSMIETGLPTFSPSIAFNSSRFSSRRSASASNASARARGVAVPHSANAAFAAPTAASTSEASLEGTEPITAPVAGASTSSVAPLWAGTHFPPMKLRCATTTPFLFPTHRGPRAPKPQGIAPKEPREMPVINCSPCRHRPILAVSPNSCDPFPFHRAPTWSARDFGGVRADRELDCYDVSCCGRFGPSHRDRSCREAIRRLRRGRRC